MKKFFYLVIAMIPFFTSCSDDIEENEVSVEAQSNKLSEHQINKDDALGIVKKYFKGTRSIGSLSYNCVLTTDRTRSEAINNDTIAHIFNMGDNDGFMVISSDNRIAPILAFSDKGHFSYEENENDMVYVNFIQRLEARMSQIKDTDAPVAESEDVLAGCVSVSPKLSTQISQGAPWNRLVAIEHPGCPTGCVPTALVQVMIACKDSLNYHGETYNLNVIEKALSDKLHEDELNPNNDYEIAQDINMRYGIHVYDVANMVYHIGKDLKTVYTPDVSNTSVFAARKYLVKYGYNVLNSTYIEYNIQDIASSVDNGNIAILVGHDRDETAHMWLVDGVKFCWNNPNDHSLGVNPDLTYLHCNWGWGGFDDGYYNGSVFRTTDHKFSEITYISVKKEYVLGRH